MPTYRQRRNTKCKCSFDSKIEASAPRAKQLLPYRHWKDATIRAIPGCDKTRKMAISRFTERSYLNNNNNKRQRQRQKTKTKTKTKAKKQKDKKTKTKVKTKG